uniref:Uncharacterized protein n=1 Tax=Clytia hemisphaerica TaxID=252671 RepID=A0A7M6DS30_9CNID|eukprot:TCONS_00040937-protein
MDAEENGPKKHAKTPKETFCSRSKGWCGHAGATYFYQDCDGDGILDPICSDTNGNLGIIKSSQKCKSEWPHAVCRAKGATCVSCRRHKSWCSHAKSVYILMDCDGDGTPDPV